MRVQASSRCGRPKGISQLVVFYILTTSTVLRGIAMSFTRAVLRHVPKCQCVECRGVDQSPITEADVDHPWWSTPTGNRRRYLVPRIILLTPPLLDGSLQSLCPYCDEQFIEQCRSSNELSSKLQCKGDDSTAQGNTKGWGHTNKLKQYKHTKCKPG